MSFGYGFVNGTPWNPDGEVTPQLMITPDYQWDIDAKKAFLAASSAARLNSIPQSLPLGVPQPVNTPDSVWDAYTRAGKAEAAADAKYLESLPANYDYRTWESAKVPAASAGTAATAAPKSLLDANGLASYIRAGKAGNGTARTQHLLGLGYSPEQIAAAQALVNRSMRRTPLPVKTAPVAAAPAVTSAPKPEAQLAASLFRARQQSARNALGGLSPAEGVQRGIIPYEALAYF